MRPKKFPQELGEFRELPPVKIVLQANLKNRVGFASRLAIARTSERVPSPLTPRQWPHNPPEGPSRALLGESLLDSLELRGIAQGRNAMRSQKNSAVITAVADRADRHGANHSGIVVRSLVHSYRLHLLRHGPGSATRSRTCGLGRSDIWRTGCQSSAPVCVEASALPCEPTLAGGKRPFAFAPTGRDVSTGGVVAMLPGGRRTEMSHRAFAC